MLETGKVKQMIVNGACITVHSLSLMGSNNASLCHLISSNVFRRTIKEAKFHHRSVFFNTYRNIMENITSKSAYILKRRGEILPEEFKINAYSKDYLNQDFIVKLERSTYNLTNILSNTGGRITNNDSSIQHVFANVHFRIKL